AFHVTGVQTCALPISGAAADVGSTAGAEMRELGVLRGGDGVIEEHERQLIEGAFRLDKITAWDIMTPRVDIFSWKDSLRLADIADRKSTRLNSSHVKI